MNSMQPIRDQNKILGIKKRLREQKHPRDYLLFVMGINLALRISDLTALKIGDLINDKGEPADSLDLRVGKTNREQVIELNETVRDAIAYYLKKTKASDPSKFVFTAYRTGNRLNRVRAHQLTKNWCEGVGLYGKYGTHTLRKTWGFMARQSGIDLSIISEKLGHLNNQVTRRYLCLSQQEVGAVEKKFNL